MSMVKLFLLQIVLINLVVGLDINEFLDEFCECHEDELNMIAGKCKTNLKKEVNEVYGVCITEVRDSRAPHKSIDGKYIQFVVCDKEISVQYWKCLKDGLSKLKVNYDASKSSWDFWECFNMHLQRKKKMDQIKEERDKPGIDKKKKKKKKP